MLFKILIAALSSHTPNTQSLEKGRERSVRLHLVYIYLINTNYKRKLALYLNKSYKKLNSAGLKPATLANF